MKLKSFNYFVGLLIIFLYSPLLSEEKIDIWKNKKEIITESPNQDQIDNQKKPGEKLCAALQGMGTTFIKLGQFLATRPDIIGEEMAKDLDW